MQNNSLIASGIYKNVLSFDFIERNNQKVDRFCSIVENYKNIELDTIYQSELAFDLGGIAGIYGVGSEAAVSLKNIEAKHIIETVKGLNDKAKGFVELIKNETQDNKLVRKELLQIRLEILAIKSDQLSSIMTTLFQSEQTKEQKKNNQLIEEVIEAYTECLQEVSGTTIFSDEEVKEFFIKNIEDWKEPILGLVSLYQNKISLEKKLVQMLSLKGGDSGEVLKLYYECTSIQLQIESKEREILNRLTSNKVDLSNLFHLRGQNTVQIEAVSKIMHDISKEIKQKYGRAALEQIHQRKWVHTLWGEALKQRSQEIDFTAEDKGIVRSFLEICFFQNVSFESKVDQMKAEIRALKVELDEKEEGDSKETLRGKLVEQQLSLYTFLYKSSLKAINEGNREVIQSQSNHFLRKIVQLLGNSIPHSFSSWAKDNLFIQDQEIFGVLAENSALQENLPELFKELENLYKQNQILHTLKEDSLNYLEACIGINQSKLQILQIQRKLESQILLNSPFKEKIQVRVLKSNDAADSIAKENERLIRELNALNIEFDEQILVVNKKNLNPWKLTSWGEILIANKSVFAEWANSFSELTNGYARNVEFFQGKIDSLIIEIEQRKNNLEIATTDFERVKNFTSSVNVQTLTSTPQIEKLQKELTIQKMHLLQVHMDRMVELIGDRQAGINQWTKEISDNQKELFRPEIRNNPYTFRRLTSEISENQAKIASTQEEVNILNRKFDEFIQEYEHLQGDLQNKFEGASFYEIIKKLAQDLVEQVLPNQLTSRIVKSSEIRKRIEYARAGYSMMAEVSKFFIELGNPGSEEAGKPIFERQIIEVNKFISWTKKHPNTASYLGGDIVQVLSVLKQDNVARQIENGLKATLYTRALLNQLHQNGDEPIETEEDFRYKAIADLFKRMPAAAGTLLGAMQGIKEASGLDFQSLSKVLWGAAKGAAFAQTAQTVRQIIPSDLEQTALAITEALQGKEIQEIMNDIYKLELVNVGSGLVRKMFNPTDIVLDIKDWWQKIYNAENGFEKMTRIVTQVVLPIISLIASTAVAVSTTSAGGPIAVILLGTTGPVGILVAIGIIGAIAGITLAGMAFSNRVIDFSSYGFKTYEKILKEKEERQKADFKQKLENAKEKKELKDKLKEVADSNYSNFLRTRLIYNYSYLELPEDMRIVTKESVRGVKRFYELAEELLKEKRNEEIEKFKAMDHSSLGVLEYLEAFQEQEIEKKLEQYLDKLFNEHIATLGRQSEISEKMFTIPKAKQIKGYSEVSEYVKYEPIRRSATDEKIATLLEKKEGYTQQLTVRTHIDKLAKENEQELPVSATLDLLKMRKQELIRILLNNHLKPIYGKGGWLERNVEKRIKIDFYASWDTYIKEAHKDPKEIRQKRVQLDKACKKIIQTTLEEKGLSEKEAKEVALETFVRAKSKR